eukprot:3844115-Pyramimonas_sp.AAC.1
MDRQALIVVVAKSFVGRYAPTQGRRDAANDYGHHRHNALCAARSCLDEDSQFPAIPARDSHLRAITNWTNPGCQIRGVTGRLS